MRGAATVTFGAGRSNARGRFQFGGRAASYLPSVRSAMLRRETAGFSPDCIFAPGGVGRRNRALVSQIACELLEGDVALGGRGPDPRPCPCSESTGPGVGPFAFRHPICDPSRFAPAAQDRSI